MSKSLTTTAARLDAIESDMREIRALLTALVPADAPAKKSSTKAPKKAARKVAKKAPAKVTKGAQTRESLSRKDWNRTLTAKARFAGGQNYALVLAQWDDAQALRDGGSTPDEALEALTSGIVTGR